MNKGKDKLEVLVLIRKRNCGGEDGMGKKSCKEHKAKQKQVSRGTPQSRNIDVRNKASL